MLSGVRSSRPTSIETITSQISDLNLNFLELSISPKSLLSSFIASKDIATVKSKSDFRLYGIF